MQDKKKNKVESLFYNNKFLAVFSVVLAVIIWASAKINYSAETVRTVNDVRISLENTLSENSDFVYFIEDEKLYVDVELKGKAYNINSKAISMDDIIVEANGAYIDSSGYKVLTLSARLANRVGNNVEIVSVSPSTIAVYYDRQATYSFNVEAKLKNDLDTLAEGEYSVGQPVASLSTVDVTGPVTMLNKLKSVYFEAEIAQDKLPLTSSTEVPATVGYKFDGDGEAKFLVCTSINSETNMPTVTVPVYVTGKVPVGVKFINQPSDFDEEKIGAKITPEEVEILYNPKNGSKYDVLYVGTIDFRDISNSVNTFSFSVDEKLGASVTDKDIKEFRAVVDMSHMSKKVLREVPGKIVYLNMDDKYDYSIDFGGGSLNNIVIIGPEESLGKISADDIQIEVNVSSLNLSRSDGQVLEVSNISIQSDVSDCWVYGRYTASVTATGK